MAAARQGWQVNDVGILRKKDEEEEEELLVFGYSCKLFRDDEKALYIDQGKHLIPWMGDESLKIDRYDARGALYDLKSHEPGPDCNRWLGLSDAERRAERLCDEERYRALRHDEEQEKLYQEEELKRLHQALDGQAYGQVAFNYDEAPTTAAPSAPGAELGEAGQAAAGAAEEEGEDVERGDEPFVAPPELDVPVDVLLPPTRKLNAIIERTALFIARQGPQMEILLKMKQAGRPQFEFLSFDAPLHPYYRHVLNAIKSGRYQPRPQTQEEEEEEEDDGDDCADHYLHPSLASRVELAPSIPSISYKPSADCAYSMLVDKIRRKQEAFVLQPPGTSDGPELPPPTQPVAMPPGDVQLIIDKMASYVAKNGRDFEAIVRGKGDKRFDFLTPGHQYHAYYQQKLGQYSAMNSANASSTSASRDTASKGSESADGSHSSGPVSFSIKKPKESEPSLLEKRSALPVEESSDEEGVSAVEDGEVREEEVVHVAIPAPPQAELIDLTEDTGDAERKAKWAEERLKDRLAAAAREKVAAAAKERQLQLERRRRAAAFLSRIKKPPEPLVMGPLPADGTPVSRASPDDDVSSLPSPNSSDVPSPLRSATNDGGVSDPPTHNGTTATNSPLFARIQASKAAAKTVRSRSSSSSSPETSHRPRHKHKRKHREASPSRSRRHKQESSHSHLDGRKSKDKSRSRSTSHSKRHRKSSHHHHSERRHSHRKRSRSRSDSQGR